MHIVHFIKTTNVSRLLLLVCFIFASIQMVNSRVYTDVVAEGSIANKMPCCKESIGNHVCLEMRQRRPYEFKMRCRSDVDFAMLQCCRTCRTNVAQLGRELFSHGASSRHCFDRHNRRFCSHFVRKSGIWATFGNNLHSGCNGENAALAFRVCRRSCGFCRVSLYKEDEDTDRCKTRPEVTTEPPSILTGVMPDRTFHSYLDRIIDEINDDYNVHSSPKQHKQPLLNETFLSQL